MKKFFCCVLACVLVVGLALSAKAAEGTLDKIAKEGKVVVATAPGYYPFEMTNKKGELVGYDIDVGQAIADALGVKLELRQFEFPGLIPALQTGEVDIVLSGMSITGPRALSVSFSNPYFDTGVVLMLRKENADVQSWKDLDKKGKKIATPQGQTSTLLAQAVIKEAELVYFPTFPETAMALVNGQIDGLFYDEPGVLIYEATYPDEVRVIHELISLESVGMACRLNDFAMINWLNSFLYQYKGSPREIASRNKWMNDVQGWLKEVQ